jgi:16S rRNA (guanine527-N7)-methyltransferase
MSKLAGFCLPFVKRNGFMYAMKGPSGREESIAAESIIKKLGGSIEKFEEMRLYDSVENEYMKRTIVIIKKT